jgi:glycolate oxidase iron-sulfur subunit
MATAVEKCVHCGFCLATCPTYTILQEEMDSPRGRIILMKSVLEGTLELEQALPYIDRCLGCLSCVTACPSGVQYEELLTPFRGYAEEHRQRKPIDNISRRMVHDVLPYPSRFQLAAKAGRMARPIQSILPEQLRSMLSLLPESLPQTQPLPEVYPPKGTRRARVALLAGCVQQSLAPEINWATLRVLSQNGVEVIVPKGQGCCGALALHAGELDTARSLAEINFKAFPNDVDAIVVNAAGCGSAMQEYPSLFAATESEEFATKFSDRVKDISVFLDELGIEPPPPLPSMVKIAYHDACHLAHAQQVTQPPRRLLQSIPNLSLVPVPEAELCCGSAGTYNIEQPETANLLGERKAKNLLNTNADAIATGNIGCLVQLQQHVNLLNQNSDTPVPIWHTIEVLDRAYRSLPIAGIQ